MLTAHCLEHRLLDDVDLHLKTGLDLGCMQLGVDDDLARNAVLSID